MSLYDISVRHLVEFLLRHGDIEPGRGSDSPERARQGSRIHRQLQSRFQEEDPDYIAEKPVSYQTGGSLPLFTVGGRADGLRVKGDAMEIDEIKTTDRDIRNADAPDPLHLAQGRCYAGILAGQMPEIRTVSVRVIYCRTDSMELKIHTFEEPAAEAAAYFQSLLQEYVRWVLAYQDRKQSAQEELKQLRFPHAQYREGQRGLAVSVYRAIRDGDCMFANAPTGIGKTISALFPALKAMGEGLCAKIFYLTARNAGALPPADTMDLLRQQAPSLSFISLTAKEKICRYHTNCDPVRCPRAKGHFDRINGALWGLVSSSRAVDRELLLRMAEKHNVCPFELGLDYSFFADVIIGDYNYLFDPRARLARFFKAEGGEDYVFLVDEAHNLPDRARTMYTASVESGRFTALSERVARYSRTLSRALTETASFLETTADRMLEEDLREEFRFTQEDGVLPFLEKFCESMRRFQDSASWRGRAPEELKEELLSLYFDALFYLDISDLYDDKFCFLKETGEGNSLKMTLFCAEPSGVIRETCRLGRASVFFSGTLAPIRHYIEMLGGLRDEPVVDIPSPFPAENRLTLAAYDVATVYRRRERYYDKAAEYVRRLTELPTGNYMVFFGSYRYLKEVEARLPGELLGSVIVSQPTSSRPEVREKFLRDFLPSPEKTRIGLCVLGGIYSEGVDLTGDRLSGVIIVGVGLPMICRDNEVIRAVTGKDDPTRGFRTAYVFPGINKVLQAAGRVIRTEQDRGFVVFLDERYQSHEYEEMMPPEYQMQRAGTIEEVFRRIRDFL